MTEPLYLLDSNICVYILSDAASHPARHVQRHEPGSVETSAIVAAAMRFFDIVPIYPFDDAAAKAYRSIPFRRGRFDRLIGAHALALELTLITTNEADFADIPGLMIENWTLPFS